MATEIKTLKDRGSFRISVTAFEGYLLALVFGLFAHFFGFSLSWPNPKYFLGIILQTYLLKNLDGILVYKFLFLISIIHASGVPDFLLDRAALWVGGLRKVGINLQLRHIGLHRVAWLQWPFTQRNPPFEPNNSWAETSGNQILVWSPSLLVWNCFAWFITLLHS